MNEYVGTTHLANGIDSLTHLPEPREFFTKYISTRTSVKFQLTIDDLMWSTDTWSVSNLKAMAGSEEVKVEKRDSLEDRFGRGREVRMLLKDYLELFERGDEGYYLTTQDLPYDAEGRPAVYGVPLK